MKRQDLPVILRVKACGRRTTASLVNGSATDNRKWLGGSRRAAARVCLRSFRSFFTEETAMRINSKFLIALVAAAALAGWKVSAEDASPPVCYQDCITHSCQLVPEKKQIKK